MTNLKKIKKYQTPSEQLPESRVTADKVTRKYITTEMPSEDESIVTKLKDSDYGSNVKLDKYKTYLNSMRPFFEKYKDSNLGGVGENYNNALSGNQIKDPEFFFNFDEFSDEDTYNAYNQYHQDLGSYGASNQIGKSSYTNPERDLGKSLLDIAREQYPEYHDEYLRGQNNLNRATGAGEFFYSVLNNNRGAKRYLRRVNRRLARLKEKDPEQGHLSNGYNNTGGHIYGDINNSITSSNSSRLENSINLGLSPDDSGYGNVTAHEFAHHNPLFNTMSKYANHGSVGFGGEGEGTRILDSPQYGNDYSGVPKGQKGLLSLDEDRFNSMDMTNLSDRHDSELSESYSDLGGIRGQMRENGIVDQSKHRGIMPGHINRYKKSINMNGLEGRYFRNHTNGFKTGLALNSIFKEGGVLKRV